MATSSSKKTAGAFDLFKPSLAAVQRNLVPFVVLNIFSIIMAVMTLLSANRGGGSETIASNPFTGLSGNAVGAFIAFGASIALIVIIVAVVVQAMLTVLQFQSAQGMTVTLGSLWTSVRGKILRLLGLGILVGLVVVLGFVAFIVPGFIMIRRYFLAPYVLVDKNVGIIEAMKRSAAMSKNNSGSIWGVIGVTILIGLTGIVPIFGSIVSVLLGIAYSVAPALRYRELSQ